MNDESARFSRRTFLKSSTAFAALVDWRRGWTSFSLRLSSGPGWVALHRGDDLAFELRSEWFAGKASLWAEQTGQQINFGLEGSRHAGLDVAADATFEIWESSFGIKTAIHHHGLGLLFDGRAEEWLGERGLWSYLRSPATLLDVDGAHVEVSPGPVNLTADGRLRFTGETNATLRGPGIRIASIRTDLRLPRQATNETAAARQSMLLLHRDAERWALEPPRGNWRYEDPASLFDHALIEAHEEENGNRAHRVTLSSAKRRSPFRVVLDEPLFGTDGRALQLLMKQARYSLDLADGSQRMEAQLARPRSLRIGPLNLRFKAPKVRPALQAGDKGCCIVAEGSLVGAIDNAVIVHDNKPDAWDITLTSDSPQVGKYANATVKMIDKKPVLEGALNFRILRPQDALDLCFRITNVRLRTDLGNVGRLELEHNSTSADFSLLIADFPPQAMIKRKVECSSQEASDDCTTHCKPVSDHKSRLAAPTRVSMRFLTPDDAPMPLGVDTLLEWAQYPLNIAPRARNAPLPKDLNPAAPIPDSATEIVAPAGLSISPDEEHAFFSSSKLRSDSGINQIWTARLSKRIAPVPSTSAEHAKTHFPVTDDRRPSLRPLLARDLADPTDYVLDKPMLDDIVQQLAQSTANGRHCVLSPGGGAWLDFGAVWPPEINNTSSFHEKLIGLLEGSVEFTYEGWLVPTGHRVKIVESGKLQWCRQADREGIPVLVADFVARYKIIYREPRLVAYDNLRKGPAKQAGLWLPFDSITLIGKETPYLEFKAADTFAKGCFPGPPKTYNYWTWILPNGSATHAPFAFPVELADRAGTKHRTTMQMMVACFKEAYDDAAYVDKILKGYNFPDTTLDPVNPSLDLHGERVAYAKPTKMGNTSYPTHKMVLKAVRIADPAAAKASQTIPWYPQMDSASLTLEQVSAFSDPRNTADAGTTFEYATVYKQEPFDLISTSPQNNRGEVILSLKKNAQNAYDPVRLNFNGALGGGLAMPTSDVVALARKTGSIFATGDAAIHHLEDVLTKIGQNGMTVSGMFKDLGKAASLLGAVPLADVLQEVGDGVAQASQLPLLAVKQLQTLEQETVGQLQQALQPVLDFRNQAQTLYNNFKSQIQQVQTELQSTVRTASSLLRVMATEQRPSDVGALATQTLDANLAAMAKRLPAKLRLSAIQRIQAATSWPPVDDQQKPILPTLYQLRDYALNQVLSQPAQQLAQALDTAVEDLQDQLQQDLDKAFNLAGQGLGALADSLIFRFVDAVQSLLSDVGSGNIDKVVETFETISDIAAAIPSLDQSGKNLLDSLKTNLDVTAGKCDLASLQKRLDTFTQAVNTAGGQLPAPVRAKILNALQQNGEIQTACKNVFQALQAVQAKVNDAQQVVRQMLAQEEVLRQQFLQDQKKVQDAIDAARALLTLPKHINVTYDHTTPLQNSGPFLADFNGTPAQFDLHSSVLLNLDGTPPVFNIEAKVTDFRLNLIPSFPFVVIGFERATFTSVNGSAPTVNCPINANNVQLVGPLDFVADLAKKLKLPDVMVVQLSGLSLIVGLNISLPELSFGAFNIVNLSVYTALKLDFTGKPLNMIFGFANPNQHFTMTYLFLGGGGFINLEFAPSDTTTGMAVTGALEFGAMAALDFGVAHGEVHIFGGFYMSLRPNDLLLSGYYRAGGDFDVLGLISASIEFIMSLSYENRGGQAWLSGDCEVDIDVHVLFFTATVSLHMHHDFSGRSGD